MYLKDSTVYHVMSKLVGKDVDTLPCYSYCCEYEKFENYDLTDLLTSLPHYKFFLDASIIGKDGNIVHRFLLVEEIEDSIHFEMIHDDVHDGKKYYPHLSLKITFKSVFEGDVKKIKRQVAFCVYKPVENTKNLQSFGNVKDLKDENRLKEINDLLELICMFVKRLNDIDLLLAKDINSVRFTEVIGTKKQKVNKNFVVTYISDTRSVKEDTVSGKVPRNIEWNYSWIQRGHWRRIEDDSIGKSRAGERNQLGRTWVNECVKRAHLPGISNLRIVV
jgi:hypothetical protein